VPPCQREQRRLDPLEIAAAAENDRSPKLTERAVRPTGGNPEGRQLAERDLVRWGCEYPMAQAESCAIVAQDLGRADERGPRDEQGSAHREDPESVAVPGPSRLDAGRQLELRRTDAEKRARFRVIEDRDVRPEGLRHTPTF
jgi:hypothetical protein